MSRSSKGKLCNNKIESFLAFADVEWHCSMSCHSKWRLDMKSKSWPQWSHQSLLLFIFPLVLFCSICSGPLQRVHHQQTILPSASFPCGSFAGPHPRSRALTSPMAGDACILEMCRHSITITSKSSSFFSQAEFVCLLPIPQAAKVTMSTLTEPSNH